MPLRPQPDALVDPLAAARAILERPYGMDAEDAPRSYILLSLARRQDSAEAAYLLGKHYQKDRVLALFHLMEAEKKGHAQAAFDLGELAWGHVQGRFARPWPFAGDADALAIQWLEHAASMGSPQAWALLARILEARSPAGNFDETSRTAWLMAAEGGDPGAKVMLALRLRRVPDLMANKGAEELWLRSLEKAGQMPYFFQKAAELLPKVFTLGLYKRHALQGSPLAMGFLAWLLRSNPKDDWHDPEQGLLWMQKAARLGNVDQMIMLANQLWQGGEEESRAEIQQWTRQAAEAGRWMAATHLAQKYFGRGMQEQALKFVDLALEVHARELGLAGSGEEVLEKFSGGEEEATVAESLAAKGIPAAKRWLGLKLCAGGEDAQAEPLLLAAAEAGDLEAQCALGQLYLRRKDDAGAALKGITCLRKAADQGHVLAMRHLGAASWDEPAKGIEADLTLATSWYLKAAARGDRESAVRLLKNVERTFKFDLPGAGPAQALEVLRSLAKSGWIGAVAELVGLDKRGPGFRMDKAEAEAWASIWRELKSQGLVAP